jgi:uncharacterized protein YndB with AHSA1/START domain
MSLPWHPLLDSGDDFLASAPFRYVNTVDLPVPPDRTWAALTADDTLVTWTPLVSRLRWTTPRPFNVGTTREITLLRFVTARERYYRWDEGRRKTFTGLQLTVPGLRRLAEDYVVEPRPGGSRLTWTLALQPHPVLRPILILLDPLTARMIRGVARGIRSQVG